MRKRLRLKKMVSALLAVAMIGQSCLVTTAGDLTDDAVIVAMQEQAAAEAAAAPVRDELGIRMIGILGWCLVGLGFLGVALTVVLSGKPRRKRHAAHTSGVVKRSARYSCSHYPGTAYRNRVERRY